MGAATLLGFVLAAVSLFSMAGCGRKPVAEEVTQQFQLLWTTTNGTITITGYTGSGTVVTIPESINDLPVTSIGENAFLICNHLTEPLLTTVVIANGVTNIGNAAFGHCYGLTNVTIPRNVVNIGDGAFSNCRGLTNVTTGTNVTSIGEGTFAYCYKLTAMVIPASVTSVGEAAFFDCTNLTGVHFSGDAPTLGKDVFDGATNATVYYLEGTKGWGPTFGGRPTAVWKTEGGSATNGVPAAGARR